MFPDYYVYGVGGLCGPDYVGYDPPGGYVCSIHGGMHGGDGMQQATVNNGRGGGPPPGPSKGIEITVLSKDAMGEIVMERNTIKSSVFHIDKKMTVGR